ncbi:hypothetical protein M408DRAFT_333842, partial [Serendipita vermifera MAFF 305830]
MASLVFEAAESGIVKCVEEGGIWYTSLKEPPRLASQRPTTVPMSTNTSIQPIPASSYPIAHRAVVSSIHFLAGGDHLRHVRLGDLHSELCRQGHAINHQSAAVLTTAAVTAGVMRVVRDDDGERFALLEDPKKSKLD